MCGTTKVVYHLLIVSDVLSFRQTSWSPASSGAGETDWISSGETVGVPWNGLLW
jgi:hypothetical protein